MSPEPLTIVEARDLTKRFHTGGSFGKGHDVLAVDNVSLTIQAGEAFGLVGESGSGKSTLGRLLLRLEEPTSGQLFFEGTDITHLKERELRPLRRHMQVVFQDPFTALNPWMTVRQAIAEPLRIVRRLSQSDAAAEIRRLLDLVGMSAASQDRLPKEFSGGQRQRICLARALALEPRLLILDEPTSALDVSVQAQILNLLSDMHRDLGLTYLLITHDLAVVAYLCSRVGVMRRGQLLEIASREEFVARPGHEYTRMLRDAVPEIGRPLRSVEGLVA